MRSGELKASRCANIWESNRKSWGLLRMEQGLKGKVRHGTLKKSTSDADLPCMDWKGKKHGGKPNQILWWPRSWLSTSPTLYQPLESRVDVWWWLKKQLETTWETSSFSYSTTVLKDTKIPAVFQVKSYQYLVKKSRKCQTSTQAAKSEILKSFLSWLECKLRQRGS